MADPQNHATVVFVQLLNESVEVYRPVSAEHVHDNVYCPGITHDYHSGEENWEFPPGALVECTTRVLDRGPALVAIRIA